MPAAKSKKAAASASDLLAAAFDIIAESGWSGFSFQALADRAGVTLAELRRRFRSRAAILDALGQTLDGAMLAVDREELNDLPLRDRVFELMMSRLEAMAPFRVGLIRLAKDARQHPELAILTACRLDRSMAWLQDSAGLPLSGLRARLQRHLLTGVYIRALTAWTADDSLDMAKTMAGLDKDLRRVAGLAGLDDRQR
jgi:AcrR family transcriptional regulator